MRATIIGVLRFAYIADLWNLRGILGLLGTLLGLAIGAAVSLQVAAKKPHLAISNETAFTCIETFKFIKSADKSASLSNLRESSNATELTAWIKGLADEDTMLFGDETDGDQVPAAVCWLSSPGNGVWVPRPRSIQILGDADIEAELRNDHFSSPQRWPASASRATLPWLRENRDRLDWPPAPAIEVESGRILSAIELLPPNVRKHAKWALLRTRRTLNVLVVRNDADARAVRFRLEVSSDAVRARGGQYELHDGWVLAGTERELQPGALTWTLVETQGGVLDPSDPNLVSVVYDRTPIPSPEAAKSGLSVALAVFVVIVLLNVVARRATFLKLTPP